MLVKIEVYNDGESWCARSIGQDIFTQGQKVDELYKNIREAVAFHFDGVFPPSPFRLLASLGYEVIRQRGSHV